MKTLVQLLTGICPRLRLFDMGRRLVEISTGQFLDIENGTSRYPWPLQQHAWIGVLLPWPQTGEDTNIWFLKLPLDEQGILNPFARDDLLRRLLERLGGTIGEQHHGEQLGDALEDNPYHFKPREALLAAFHARASRLLDASPSRHYTHALAYFKGELGWEQWPFVGYQGIADVAARHDKDGNIDILTQALPRLPERPLEALCHCLENERVPAPIAVALARRGARELRDLSPDGIVILASIIRGLSYSSATQTRDAFVDRVLRHPVANDPAILAAISGRAWEMLVKQRFAQAFLERLAVNTGGQAQFNACLTDLLYLPGMREPLLQVLRAPDRSQPLSLAVGRFFHRITG
ncbi:MAG: DUF3549 family protein [Gammaproteobacteria bacterium]|nr:DUF3549 family protein [Gammaproteobacteria bacterium]